MAPFSGDKKIGNSLLLFPENRFKKWAVPKLPVWLETWHLTMLTVLWSLINVLAAIPAKKNHHWLWLVNLMIVAQYVTDLFDGELGRQRNTGLIKWGFYMDHFLDYVFMCSMVFVGYRISPAGLEIWYFWLLAVLGAFMVNSFLSFAATNEFQIYYCGLGPTEFRLVLVFINIFIIYFGTKQFYWLVPATVVCCTVALIFNSWVIHKKLWAHDMKTKRRRAQE
ncbi:CDP-alcohol phosphatidyltransferase family protein [Lentisphaerota bacterium ZTH]|nr:CDP-alcohol phosphatidyltransferase family protein [Lentisphaerota bacterium]WET06446.1 CDP-alcohol phosphatidyltransferase family protein [Lentisphaerota bacterium ZTH]